MNLTLNNAIFIFQRFELEQECIPVGCVPSAAVVVSRQVAGVKTLPCLNYGADGNNANNNYSCLYIPDEVSFL